MAFKKKTDTAQPPQKPAGEAAPQVDMEVTPIHGQRSRLSCTISYKGLIVGGDAKYHPEKIDMSHTATMDHIPGETKEQTQARLNELKVTQEMLIGHIQLSISEKVGKVKERMAALKQEASQA